MVPGQGIGSLFSLEGKVRSKSRTERVRRLRRDRPQVGVGKVVEIQGFLAFQIDQEDCFSVQDLAQK
jgi:hypothetical protein